MLGGAYVSSVARKFPIFCAVVLGVPIELRSFGKFWIRETEMHPGPTHAAFAGVGVANRRSATDVATANVGRQSIASLCHATKTNQADRPHPALRQIIMRLGLSK